MADIAEVDEISKLLESFYLKTEAMQDIPTPQDVVKRREDRQRLGKDSWNITLSHECVVM